MRDAGVRGQTVTIEMTKERSEYWKSQERWPVVVEINAQSVRVCGTAYRIAPNAYGGYFCYRPAPSYAVLGEIYKYGVRGAMNDDLHRELSAIRSAVFGTSYPAPLCYELRGGALVHPGPCYDKHPQSVIKTTKYHLSPTVARTCATCGERFL